MKVKKTIKAERQNLILSIIDKEKKIIASDLSIRLEVSEDTIRRDLNELDEKGLMKRVHSGAIKIGPSVVDFSDRETLDLEEKIRLAKKAVKYIKANDVVIIDGGTTNYQLIKQLPKDLCCTVFSNSLPILILLKEYPQVKVVMLGGILFKQSMVSIGYDVIKQLDSIHADIYFMGIANVDEEFGVSIVTLEECQTKQKMLAVASKTVGLVTKNKFGTFSNYVIGKVNDITEIIIDDE